MASDNLEDDLNKVYSKILNDSLKRQRKQLNAKIAIAEEKGNTKESEDLLKKYLDLVKK